MTFVQPAPERTVIEEPIAQWRKVSVRYPFEDRDAVGPVTLELRRGERVLLLGASGSGKSTLLLTLTGLIPRSIPAELRGEVRIGRENATARQPAAWAADVAQYFQEAEQTLCGMRVEDELAFALENRAVPESEIERQVVAVMHRLELPQIWRKRRVSTLSGGERQLVALAATLVQGAPLFVADEPTAHLAPEAARRLHALVAERDLNLTVLIVDHRLDGLVESIDRLVVLGPDAAVLADGDPRSIFRAKRAEFSRLGIWCPAATELDAALGEIGLAPARPPLGLDETLAHLSPESADPDCVARARPVVSAFLRSRQPSASPDCSSLPVIVEVRQASCAPFLGPIALRDVTFSIRESEIVAILGANGAGKSTLGLCLAGLLPLKAGQRIGSRGGVAFQRSENQFVGGSVREELDAALPSAMGDHDRVRSIENALCDWGLSELENRHPFTLSQGEKRRLALATLTISDRWPLLVLDEPTAGLDAAGAAALSSLIADLAQRKRAVAVITHDMDLALRLCPRSIILAEGGVIADGGTQDLLGDTAIRKRAGLAEPAAAAAIRWLARAASC